VLLREGTVDLAIRVRDFCYHTLQDWGTVSVSMGGLERVAWRRKEGGDDLRRIRI
jgi:hypothetical protein